MRSTKKLLVLLMVVSIMAVSVFPVFAEDTALSESAQICTDIGMLRGSGSGVTAEYTATVPTRLQVGYMVLRLKGLEDDALAFTGTDNFSDVSKVHGDGPKILAYLKANPALGFGGFDDGTFRPLEPITGQQFYKILLTILGYTQDVDFQWAGVFEFAATVGLTQITAETDFTVDSLAIATVEALKAAVYGSNDTLAGVLVAAGKLDANKVQEVGLPTTIGPVPIPIDPTASYMSVGENFGWQNYIYDLGENTAGKQYASFYMTPLIDAVDGSVDFADSDTDVGGFGDLAMLVRMSSAGFFDVRNGPAFEKLAEVAVTINTRYFVEVFADMIAKTYTVYVTPPEGERTMIAENYAFRPSAADADDMGKAFFISAHANDQIKVENMVRRAMLDSTASYLSKGENFGWQQNGLYMGGNNTGKQQIDYDITPFLDNVDGSVDFTDSSKQVAGFGDLAMLIRMNSSGLFDVRNGAVFEKLADVPFSANVKYHVKIIADMDAKTYTVFVTAPGGTETMIAENYAFRPSAADADDVGQVFVISAHASDQIKVENITIKPAP